MLYRNQFTAHEWATLQFAPLWVFTMVAAIDGRLEHKEMSALAKELAEAPLFRNPLAREVLLSVRDNFASVWEAYRRDSRSAIEGLRDVRTILENKVDSQTANGFCRALIFIGHQVIESSSTGIFRRKEKKEEKAALVVAALILGVRPE